MANKTINELTEFSDIRNLSDEDFLIIYDNQLSNPSEQIQTEETVHTKKITKADFLNDINNSLETKIDQNTLDIALAKKADSSTVSQLSNTVSSLSTTVSGLSTTVSQKANQSALTSLTTRVSTLESGKNEFQTGNVKLTIQSDGNVICSRRASSTADFTQIWNTGPTTGLTSSVGRLLPFIKKTVSGTTTANGNLNLSLSSSDYFVVALKCTSPTNTACAPAISGGNWYAQCINVNNTTHTPRTSTEVTVEVVYMQNRF